MRIALQLGAALVLSAGPGDELDWRRGEGEAGGFGGMAVAGLDELQGDGGGLGGDRGAFEQAIGGFETAVFDLKSLGLHETEERLDRRALPAPSDDAPSRGDVARVMGRQETPMQRLAASGRSDLDTLDQGQAGAFGQSARRLEVA